MKEREKEEVRGKENENGKAKQGTWKMLHTYKQTKKKKNKKQKNITAWVSSQDKPISFQITKIIIKPVSTVKYTKLD